MPKGKSLSIMYNEILHNPSDLRPSIGKTVEDGRDGQKCNKTRRKTENNAFLRYQQRSHFSYRQFCGAMV